MWTSGRIETIGVIIQAQPENTLNLIFKIRIKSQLASKCNGLVGHKTLVVHNMSFLE